ncbi:MATE family efflux transporter [Actibacterium lipolyticum]|nr:MATE family efflux transporter [Actibacterium lipolyticum]
MAAELTYPQHLRALLVLGLPLIGSNLAQFAISLTDAVMLGWYDVEALAGQVLGSTVFFILFLFGSGFALAVMPMIATAAASGEERQVRRVTRMGLWQAAAFGVLTLPVFLASGPLLRAAGQADSAAQLAHQYLVINGWAMVPALIVMVLKSYLAALERTRVVLWVTLGAVGVNILVNYALIFGNWNAPELGIRGAAIASLVVHIASMLALVAYAAWATPEHTIFQRLWRPDWEAAVQVFRLGWPIGLTSLAEVGLFGAASLMMGWLGTLPLAAHGIALQIASATFMAHLGLSSAVTVLAGKALGQRNEANLRRTAIVGITLSMSLAGATMVLFFAMPETLIGLFLDPADPARSDVMAIAVGLLAAAAVFQVADSAQVMALGLLRGVQDTRVPMVMAGISYWLVGMPVAYALGFVLDMGGVGIWLGLAAGLALAGVLMMTRFWRGRARLARS